MFHMLMQHLGEQTTSNMFQHLGPVLTTCGTTFRPAGLAVDVTARQTAKRLRDYANEHIDRAAFLSTLYNLHDPCSL